MEIEEVHIMGKYNEGGKRPLKVKMRSQVAIKKLLARTRKLAGDPYKNICIKRDMNQEEREKEKNLRSKAKNRDRKKDILLEGLGHEVEKMVPPRKGGRHNGKQEGDRGSRGEQKRKQ